MLDSSLPPAIRTTVENMPDSLLARSGLIDTPGAWGRSIQGSALVSMPPSIPVGLNSGL